MIHRFIIKTIFLIVILCLFFLISCEKQIPLIDEPVETIRDPKFIFFKSSNMIFFSAKIQSHHDGTTLSSAWVIWSGTSGNDPDTLQLNDEGIDGDIISQDGVFSREVINDLSYLSNTLPIDTKGEISVQFIANYIDIMVGLSSSFTIGNTKPVLLEIVFPDTMYRPQEMQDSEGNNYYTIDTIVVKVYDFDGSDDIDRCFLLFQKPDSSYANNGEQILLFDDGLKISENALWDDVANDGNFSRLITIGYENMPGDYRAYFNAMDNSGEDAEEIIKTLVVRDQ